MSLFPTPSKHHDYLLSELQKVETGETQNLMVNMPPGSAKSSYSSVVAPTYFMGKKPERLILGVSAVSELAEHFSRRVRNIVASAAYKALWGFGVSADSSAADRWDNERGGGYFAAGVGKAIPGRRADIGLIDDPVKNREAADSNRQRETDWQWYLNDFLPRLKPRAPQICVMCMVGDTRVLMADGSNKELRKLRPGDLVASYDEGRLVVATVRNWANQGPDFVYEIRMKSGITVRANERHPFLVARDGSTEWVRLKNLKIGDKILRASGENGAGSFAQRMDATSPRSAEGSATLITTKPCGRADIGRHQQMQNLGARQGCGTDTGSNHPSTRNGLSSRVVCAPSVNSRPQQTCGLIGAGNSVLTTNTEPAGFADCFAMTATSQLDTGKPPISCLGRLNTYEIIPDCIDEIVEAGREDVFDIQVDDTENFIANGLVSHNTRWHEDDLGGRILEREAHKWRVVSLPMIAGANDPLGRNPGDLLWPEWFTPEMVERAQMDMRSWNALYQQNPVPDDGSYFKSDWFGEYDQAPEQLSVYGASDFAVTDGAGDYTEHGVFGVDHNSNIYVLDWWRGQTASDVWIERMCDLIRARSPMQWFGESGPIRRAVEPFLMRRMQERNAYCWVEWLPSIADKTARARSIQARASMGKVFFPKHATWKGEVMQQMLRFPTGKHDDAVDVFSLIGRALEDLVTPPTMQRPQEHAGEQNWMS